MNPTKLNDYENSGIEAAAEATISDVVESVLQHLWKSGVRDLEALNSENFENILTGLSVSPEYREALRKTFLAYGQHVRTALTNLRD